jgi:hypothetical protein
MANLSNINNRLIVTDGGNLLVNATANLATYGGITIDNFSDPSIAMKTTGTSGWLWTQYITSTGTNNFSMGVNQSSPYWCVKAGAGMDSPHLVVNSSGNVGIGTISPTSPTSVGTFLEIRGRNGIGGGTAGIVLKDYDNDGWDIWNSGGQLNFRYNNDGAVGFFITSAGDTTFAGNVTVGANTVQNGTNPGLKIQSTNISQTVLGLHNTTSGNWEVAVGGSANTIGAGKFYVYDNTADAGRLVIDTSGNAMIGGTSTFNGVTGETGFEIYGNTAQLLINNPSYNWFTIYSASDSNIYNVFGSSGNYLIGTGNKDTSNWSEKMRIDSSGNLTLKSASVVTLKAGPLGSTYGGGFNAITVTGTSSAPYTSTLGFSNYGVANAMVIEGANVGIGTTSPGAELQVVGRIKTTRIVSSNIILGNIRSNVVGTAYLLLVDLNITAGFSLAGKVNAASYTTWNVSDIYVRKNYNATTGYATITGISKSGSTLSVVDISHSSGRFIALKLTGDPEVDVMWAGYRLDALFQGSGEVTTLTSGVTENSVYASY